MEWQVTGVGRKHVDVGRVSQFTQQTHAVRIEIGRKNHCLGISPREELRLAAGSGAAVQNLFSSPYKQSYELRRFVLDGGAAFTIGSRLSDIAIANATRAG